MDNPFTLVFGKEPLLTIRREDLYSQIIADFTSKNPTSPFYILTGARGTGKTVLLSEEYHYFDENEDWVVVDVNPHRNLQEDLASAIYEKGRLRHLFLKAEFNFSFHGLSFSLEGREPVSSVSSVLEKMFTYLQKKGKKVLITMDEVVPNANVKAFAHDYQGYLRKGYDVFLLMTGLYENIMALQNDKSLTFLYRAPKILLRPLDLLSVKNSYTKELRVDGETAEKLAKLTAGYGFAYQLVGHLYYDRKCVDEEFLQTYDQQLKINAYDKIWSSLGENERKIVKTLIHQEERKTSEILLETGMNNKNYSVYRERLIQKGVAISHRNGFLSIALPRLEQFIENIF